MHTPDPSRAHRPLLDHLVSVAVGKALAWLGRRAIDRGDRHDFDHCVAALRAGDCTDVCTQARTDRTSR